MKPELSCIVNRYGTSSEAFLDQLFQGLASQRLVEVISLSRPAVRKQGQLIIRRSPSKWSPGFLLRVPYLMYLLNQFDIRCAYRLHVIRSCRAAKLYFPFISMTREFVEAIARSQKKVFTSIRGTDITITPSQRPDVILAYQTAMKYLKGVHYLSHELRQASHKLGIRHGTERVIYQGIDFRKFVYNATPSQDKLRIATVGRLHYVKGLEFFLLACYYLKREGIEFEATVVGEGSDLWRLKHLCRYLELEAFVTFFGTVAHDDMGQLLSRHNVYVHTHLVTGLSNTMLEAIASNLTVVCFGSNLASYIDSGISELIREVPKGDVLALKQALVNVRNSQSFGNDQTKVNRALETFSLEKHVDSFKEFLGFKQLRSE